MSLVVYKYEVPIADEFYLLLPIGWRPLAFQVQHDKPVLWCQIDQSNIHDRFRFVVRGTGHTFEHEDILRYIGTVQHQGFVWHLWGER